MQTQPQSNPKLIQDILTHIDKAKNELESVLNFCNDLCSKEVRLTNDELFLIKYSLEERIDQGIRANQKLANDKLDLSPFSHLIDRLDKIINSPGIDEMLF